MIKKIETYLPNNTLTNEALVKDIERWSPEEIFAKTGIHKRVIASSGETSLQMGKKACDNLFESLGKVPEIDFILFCTQFPDYNFPPNATLLQSALGLSSEMGAFDFNLACSGYIYGLQLAKALLYSKQAKNILLVTADTYTHHIAKDDYICRPIFGDAATATLCSEDIPSIIDHFCMGTDGEHGMRLSCSDSGERAHLNLGRDGSVEKSGIYMEGPEVFNFTLRNVPNSIKSTLKSSGYEINDIDYFILHQANSFMLEYLRKRIGAPKEKFIIEMTDTGNTVSSSIPIILSKMIKDGRLASGKRVILSGFGVGFSWGSCFLEI